MAEAGMIEVKRLSDGDPLKFEVIVREGKGQTAID
jgi:hypothetical protein